MSSLTITTEQIIDHRASRKAAGFTGCISGKPVPEIDLFGYKDVQSWRPSDPMDPHCLCFDCRALWDNDGSIDLQLILDGHEGARRTYAELLPVDMRPLSIPMSLSSETETFDLGCLLRSHRSPPSFGLPSRSNGLGIDRPLRIDTSIPRYGSFDDVPMSLSAPRAVSNLKNELASLKGDLQAELITVMDSRRKAVFYSGQERSEFLASVDTEEQALWKKLDAVTLLLN